MNIKNANKSHKKTIVAIVLAVILLVGGGYIAVAATNGIWPFTSEQQNDESNSSDQESENNQDETNDSDSDSTDETTNNGTNQDPEDDNTNEESNDSSARINIPSYQAANGTISVNVAINESWNSGECIMELSGTLSQTIREDVFAQAQISGCQLVAENLPAGSYEAAIYAERDGKRTNTETLEIRI